MDCPFLSHGLHIEKYEIRDCCVRRNGEKEGFPFIMQFDDIENIDYNKLFSLKKDLKQEKIEDPAKCKGCIFLSDFKDYSNDENYISYISFNHWNTCNSNCIYCDKKYNGGNFYYNVLPFVKGLIETNSLKPCGEILFLGGEPTLLPEFNDLLDIFIERNFKIKIFSSGIKYSQSIENGLKNGLVNIVISSDTGKKETYERIKRVKQFDRVWENIKKYASVDTGEHVKAKMIIIPGINDSIEEVDLFLQKAKEANVKQIVADVEAWYSGIYEHNLPNIRYLIEYIKYKSQKEDLICELYTFALIVEQNTEKPDFPTTETEILKQYEKIKKDFSYRNVEYI